MTAFEFRLRELFTEGAPTVQWPEFTSSNNAGLKIDMASRLIDATALAKDINGDIRLQLGADSNYPKGAYLDYVPNSAELALELNDPAYYFSVYPAHTSTNTTPRTRLLWTLPVKTGTSTTATTPVDIPTFSKPIGAPIPRHTPSAPKPNPVQPVPQDLPSRSSKVIFKDLPVVPADTSKRPASSIPGPCFVLQVYVDYKGPQPLPDGPNFAPTDYIPTKNTYLNDLIFSIRKDPRRTKNNTQLLREIVVQIPHKPRTAVNDKTDALIKEDWAGGVRMLSNHRFVPFINRSKDFLQIRLVPRSAQEHPAIRMDDRKTMEVSFRLSDVDIPASVVTNWVSVYQPGEVKPPAIRKAVKELLGFARCDMYERYQISEQGVYSIWNSGTFVVKRDIGDSGH